MISEVEKKFIYKSKGKYLVSNKLFLDLIFNNKCNCDCRFCIAKTKSYANEDLDKWKLSLKKTIEVFKDEIDSLIILGGEATVDLNFLVKLKYIDELTKNNHIFTILTTNGLLLRNKEFLNKVASSCIDSINISIMNYNYEYNNYLMRGKTLTRDELKEVYKVLKNNGKTIRLNTNIAKNNLNTLEELENYINYYNGCCDVIKLTPLMKTDMFNTEDDILSYTHEFAMNKEDIKSLFNSLVNKYGSKKQK